MPRHLHLPTAVDGIAYLLELGPALARHRVKFLALAADHALSRLLSWQSLIKFAHGCCRHARLPRCLLDLQHTLQLLGIVPISGHTMNVTVAA